MTDALAAARALADEVLFPAALDVDRSDSVPPSHLDALAAAGLYGAAGPGEAGGLQLDLPTFGAVVEALASGCLATAFVWLQHHGLVRSLSEPGAPAALTERWLAPLCRGDVRAGIALTGLWPGPARLRARPAEEGWVVEGRAPWVSGWDLIDLLQVAARGPEETVVWLVVEAKESRSVRATRQRVVAADASRTVNIDFEGHFVPTGSHLRTEPFVEAGWSAGAGLRLNGSLALGVASRCLRLIGPGPLDEQLESCREGLDASGSERMTEARAAASELAVRAASALVVDRGSGAIRVDDHAQRLAREAMFLLVFGTRAAIRASLLDRFTRSAPA